MADALLCLCGCGKIPTRSGYAKGCRNRGLKRPQIAAKSRETMLRLIREGRIGAAIETPEMRSVRTGKLKGRKQNWPDQSRSIQRQKIKDAWERGAYKIGKYSRRFKICACPVCCDWVLVDWDKGQRTCSDGCRMLLRQRKSQESMLARVSASLQPESLHRRAFSNSKFWTLRGPNGVSYRFRWLRKFIEDNARLFRKEELLWKVRRGRRLCAALCGLASISPRRKHPKLSWHGWTWDSLYERRFMKGDPLARKPQESELTALLHKLDGEG